MVKRDEIVAALNDYLKIAEFKDIGRNGMQVQGRDDVKRVVVGVSASAALFKAAADKKADMVIVHHGIFWDEEGGSRKADAVMENRIKILSEKGISLLGYHLPLDGHPEIGNGVLTIRALGLDVKKLFAEEKGKLIGAIGEFEKPIDFDVFMNKCEAAFGRPRLVLPFGPKKVRLVATVTGGGGLEIEMAAEERADVYITGEPMEFNYEYAKEAGINVVYLGHYNSERSGIIALGEWLKNRFSLDVEFVDIPCEL